MLAGTAVGYTKPVEEKWPWVEGYTLGGLNKTGEKAHNIVPRWQVSYVQVTITI